jgi:Rrf2 family iron-sulfur cluster assembly transcriptional regulator
MRIGTKGRFAVIAMTDVALRDALGPVPLADIALRQHISLSYLEQVFSKLRQHGLVTSVRGPGGGYLICRQINEITLADIICAVEDAPTKVEQSDASNMQHMTQKLWDAMYSKVLDFAHTVTLKSLVLDQLAMGAKIEQNLHANRGMLRKPDQHYVHPNGPNSVFDLGRTSQIYG